MTLVCEDAVIIKTLSSHDNFFILKFFGKAFRQHKLLWCDPGPWWWHQSLVQIENHLDWLSAHLDQSIIERGQKLNTDILCWYSIVQNGVCVVDDFVCLFVYPYWLQMMILSGFPWVHFFHHWPPLPNLVLLLSSNFFSRRHPTIP